MKTSLFTLALILLVAVTPGCYDWLHHPDMDPPSPPSGLRTATGDNFIELFWAENREADISGYNVYVSSSYDGRYEFISSTTSAYFYDEGARNGNLYYYAVSAYDYDGNESELSADVAYDIPRPEGYDVMLYNAVSSPAQSGYDFSRYAVVPVDDKYADMWYVSSNGSMIMRVDTDSDIQDMGPTSSVLSIGTAPVSGWSSTHEAVLVAGHTYVVWTWDDHYAKFRVSTLSPGRVVFDWAYQLIPANRLLKRNPGKDRE
jgi:hypothetical protein